MYLAPTLFTKFSNSLYVYDFPEPPPAAPLPAALVKLVEAVPVVVVKSVRPGFIVVVLATVDFGGPRTNPMPGIVVVAVVGLLVKPVRPVSPEAVMVAVEAGVVYGGGGFRPMFKKRRWITIVPTLR